MSIRILEPQQNSQQWQIINKCWLNERMRFSELLRESCTYYHHFTDEVLQLAMYYLSSLSSPSSPTWGHWGQTLETFLFLPDDSASVHHQRDTARSQQRKGLSILIWDALCPLKWTATPSSILKPQQCSLSKEFLCHSAESFLRVHLHSLPSFPTRQAALIDRLQPVPSGKLHIHEAVVTSFPRRSWE